MSIVGTPNQIKIYLSVIRLVCMYALCVWDSKQFLVKEGNGHLQTNLYSNSNRSITVIFGLQAAVARIRPPPSF